jgi:AraC family transcriptional regulator
MAPSHLTADAAGASVAAQVAHETDRVRVLEHVEANLAGDRSLKVLARGRGVSPYHFHRVFHAAVGEAPKQYLRRLRLEVAATRLSAPKGISE